MTPSRLWTAEWWGAVMAHLIVSLLVGSLAMYLIYQAFGRQGVYALAAVWMMLAARPWEKP